jgi:hypothetical protein
MPFLERDIQKWLSFLLRGRREYVLPHLGRMDILVKDDPYEYIIEVKKATNFLCAIGQVIGYESVYESASANKEQIKIIALFGWKHLTKERIQLCQHICDSQNIQIWWLDEQFLYFMYGLEKHQLYSGTDLKSSEYFLEQFRYRRKQELERFEHFSRLKPVEVEYEFVIESSDDES